MDILFWSGGKDAYLAHEFFRRDYNTDALKLLTTFEDSSEVVPHQEISLSHIRSQAKSLELPLITIGLPENCSNEVYLQKIKHSLERQEQKQSIRYLIFGDWYLEDIRSWREESLGKLGYDCLFPIWQKGLNELLPVLLLKPVKVQISSVKEEYQPYLKVGEAYNAKLIRQLPDQIDPMGEKGEFHTRLTFESRERSSPSEQPLY